MVQRDRISLTSDKVPESSSSFVCCFDSPTNVDVYSTPRLRTHAISATTPPSFFRTLLISFNNFSVIRCTYHSPRRGQIEPPPELIGLTLRGLTRLRIHHTYARYTCILLKPTELDSRPGVEINVAGPFIWWTRAVEIFRLEERVRVMRQYGTASMHTRKEFGVACFGA